MSAEEEGEEEKEQEEQQEARPAQFLRWNSKSDVFVSGVGAPSLTLNRRQAQQRQELWHSG